MYNVRRRIWFVFTFQILGIATCIRMAAMVLQYVSEESASLNESPSQRTYHFPVEDRSERAMAVERSKKIYCEGPLLEAVQSLGLFNDSKTFVDMSMRVSPEEIQREFAQLETPLDYDIVNEFVNKYFFAADGELENWTPTDWTARPTRLTQIADPDTREWALNLNERWKELGRRVANKQNLTEARSSLLAPPFPFVAPGGRFREPYYWDSFWIVKGLLASDMLVSTKHIISNLLEYIADFGFVPNGGRVYYLNRSQPPLLSEMLLAYLDALLLKSSSSSQNPYTKHLLDLDFLRRALSLLETEYSWWMHSDHALTLPDGHILNRYSANTSSPRPESWREDVTTAATVQDKATLYGNIATAAESGWDFSSRWMYDGKHLDTTYTKNIVPVDLNAIMLRFERNLALLHTFSLQLDASSVSTAWQALRSQQEIEDEHLIKYIDNLDTNAENGHSKKAVRRYIKAAEDRRKAIEIYLWKPELGAWRDLWLDSNETTSDESCKPYASDFAMLWAGAGDHLDISVQASILKAMLPLYKRGGFATSLSTSGEQWDFPNAWPPLQYFLIRGLDRLELPAAKQLAADATNTWLQSNFLGWNTTGLMMEKYSALEPGVSGQGGEYKPEIGFGWTNGVVLDLIVDPPSLIDSDISAFSPPLTASSMSSEYEEEEQDIDYMALPLSSFLGGLSASDDQKEEDNSAVS